jgi:lipopolysaccharide export system protein LptA
MRGTRWLPVLAILAILAAIGVAYRSQKRALQKDAPAKPPMLAGTISGIREEFKFTHRNGDHTDYEIRAGKLTKEEGSNQGHLEQVELKIYNKTDDKYDLVKSAKAEFDEGQSRLYSDGEVEITLSVPVEGQPTRQLVSIKSSGVTFEVKTGRAETDRPASFTFENGTGKSVGASYDPTTRELHLRSHAEIDHKAPGPHAAPMKIEAGELTYKEAESVVWLNGGARLTRQNTVVNAAKSVVQLQADGVIRQVDAVQARGVDEYPKRKLQYAADELRVNYSEQGEVERVSGKTNARLVSISDGSETTMTSDAVDLDFETVNNESVLKKAVGNGHAMIESKPIAAPDGKLPETRVVRSQLIEVQMRPGGREIEMVQTLAPGRLDFIPNQPIQRQRRLDAARMTMKYGPANQLQSFRAVDVQTETEPSAEERAKKPAVSKTRSKNMSAEFDPKTGQMKHMEQWDGFIYEEGDRRATANRAELDQDRNLMTLDKAARVWDATGATSADRIRIDQKTGDFAAEGHVSSSRQADKKNSPSGMLSGDQPVEAMAERMTAANHNRLLHYEGHVVMWQGGDRLTAERADIDRDKRALSAAGNVVTQSMQKKHEDAETGTRDRESWNREAAVAAMPDRAVQSNQSQIPNPKSVPSSTAPTFVIVRAANLVYTDQDRLAHYTGGVVLNRPGLQVKADELRAFLAESKKEPADAKDANKADSEDDPSRIEKALADGHVEIVQAATDRTRTGTSDHAEYYTDDERIILRGGQPQMIDSKKGYARGAELTYYINDDRLRVSGDPKQRATSRLRRK